MTSLLFTCFFKSEVIKHKVINMETYDKYRAWGYFDGATQVHPQLGGERVIIYGAPQVHPQLGRVGGIIYLNNYLYNMFKESLGVRSNNRD